MNMYILGFTSGICATFFVGMYVYLFLQVRTLKKKPTTINMTMGVPTEEVYYDELPGM